MNPPVIRFIGPRARQIVQASVSCDYCAWGATQTGANAIEVAIFLRSLILKHFMERHPEIPVKDLS